MSDTERRARLARDVLDNPLFQEIAGRLKENATAKFWATPPHELEGLRAARLEGEAVERVVQQFQAELDQETIEQRSQHRHGKGD